jgi:MFS family permease
VERNQFCLSSHLSISFTLHRESIRLKGKHVYLYSTNHSGQSLSWQTLIKLTRQATILEIIARTWYVYLIAKIVCGFAAGFIGTSVMAYTSEITMPKMRGVHLSAFSLAYAIGGGACAIALEVIQQVSHQRV